MKCPFCSFIDTKVVDSRMGKDGNNIRRRRECIDCERRFTTYERVEEALPLVIKKTVVERCLTASRSSPECSAPVKNDRSPLRP